MIQATIPNFQIAYTWQWLWLPRVLKTRKDDAPRILEKETDEVCLTSKLWLRSEFDDTLRASKNILEERGNNILQYQRRGQVKACSVLMCVICRGLIILPMLYGSH